MHKFAQKNGLNARRTMNIHRLNRERKNHCTITIKFKALFAKSSKPPFMHNEN